MSKDKIKQALRQLYCGAVESEYRTYGDPDIHYDTAITALDALHTYNPTTHVAVPREPTDAMIEAGTEKIMRDGRARKVWEAMISAAQGDKCK